MKKMNKMNKINRYMMHAAILTVAAGVTWLAAPVALDAKALLYTPDGRTVHIKGGKMQPDMSPYRSSLESKVVDRRFYTKDATFEANEGFQLGIEGFADLVKAGIPVAYKRGFEWVMVGETYFYARYLLDYIGARTHSGVNMVQGPYWTMKAKRMSDYNKLQRDRGEREFSNKDTGLALTLPLVYQRVGFPRVFDDVGLSYLQYRSVYPQFIAHVSSEDTFEDPMSGKDGGWGVPNSYLNDYHQRFSHDNMDVTFDMGALGQFMKRRMQWSDYFFHSDHSGPSAISQGVSVPMLGNDAEEGLRGWGLAMGSINQLLELKGTMFTDGDKLLGINPATYDPSQGLRYVPHEIEPQILWAGDLPERVWTMDMKDNSSQLFDQVSWLQGLSAFVMSVHRRDKAWTDNPPVDGGLFEKGLGTVAEKTAEAIFKNVEAMHVRDGLLVSEWTPEGKTGHSVSMRDLTMAIVGLHDMEQMWEGLELSEKIIEQEQKLVKQSGDFLLKVQAADGSFHEGYEVPSGRSVGAGDLADPNWAGIRALTVVYFQTEDTKYLAAARKTFNLMNSQYWDEAHGVYRSRLGDDTVVVTPYSIGITLAAYRMMMYGTPTYMVDPILNRFTRWWTQTVDVSGVIQAENVRTGEVYTGFTGGDADADGIPYATHDAAPGSHGSAPVFAGKVLINIGGAGNETFNDASGDLHDPNSYGSTVRMTYKVKSPEEQRTIILPLQDPKIPGLVERDPMELWDSTVIPLRPSKPIKVGMGTVLNLTGRQIFEANCMECHGQFGEGIDGLPYDKDIDRTHDGMFKIVNKGRWGKVMPPWGVANEDGFGVLTKAEIDKIVNYIQSPGFKHDFHLLQAGGIPKGSYPRDVWFYLSRDNARAHGTLKAGPAEAQRYASKLPDPAKIKAKTIEDVPRTKPDADLTLDDRESIMQRLGMLPPASKLAQGEM